MLHVGGSKLASQAHVITKFGLTSFLHLPGLSGRPSIREKGLVNM
jgi:hypothetical protein